MYTYTCIYIYIYTAIWYTHIYSAFVKQKKISLTSHPTDQQVISEMIFRAISWLLQNSQHSQPITQPIQT